jgi:hypothetical protein
MTWWKPLLFLLAVANVVWGMFAIAQPIRAGEFVRLYPMSPAATGEVRAVYGGLLIVLGYLMFLAPGRPEGAAWLRAMGFAFLGLVAGRGASLALDGWANYTVAALAFEAASGGLLLHAASRLAAGRKA